MDPDELHELLKSREPEEVLHIGSVVISVVIAGIHSGIWGRYYGIIVYTVYVITSFFTVGIFVVVWGTISVGCFMPAIGCDW